MKRCPNCGRMYRKKTWKKPMPIDMRNSDLFERLEREVCDDCHRHKESHNPKIQVRGISIERIEPIVLKHLKKDEAKSKVENFFEKKGDLYFSSKTTARRIAGELKQMGATIKESNKLVTYDTQGSKPLMRLTISARFKLLPGDLVKTKSDVAVVAKIRDKWVWTQEGDKIRLKDAKKLDSEAFKGLVISINPPMATLETTGETIDVNQLPEVVKKGEKVELRRYDGRWWIVAAKNTGRDL